MWKGSISFGLLNIPVSLHTAEESKELHFNMLDSKDFSPIKYRKVNANTGREVPYERIVKGYEYEPDQYVVISKADFAAANPKATQTIDIEDFVLLDEIDTMMFERPYYLSPQKNGEKGYFLLRDALRHTKKVAIGKIVIRTKQHLGAIMAKGDYLVLELLRFAHEVREVHEVDLLEGIKSKGRYNPRELKMAEELIKGMTAKWEPDKYDDTYHEDIMKRIKQKVKAGKTHVIESVDEPVEKVEPSKVVDLLPLLRQSLAGKGKKPGRSPRKSRAKVKERHETAG
ncbi:MAG: Ku protein [Bdellovibrionales bacterium]|nr:Ku protein [Bdellovibrionales bacterium]